MTETIQLGDIDIQVTRKAVKNVHLSVHPPEGHITLVAPSSTRLDVVRAYAISKLPWIRRQQEKLLAQERESPRQFVTRESHYLWGRRYLLEVVEKDEKPSVKLDHKRVLLSVRPGSDRIKRAEIIHEWHKKILHGAIPSIIAKWEKKLGVQVSGYYLQRMKTKWGSCNYRAGNIRLNTELVKKPKDHLDYIILHEMAHLIEPTHSERFLAILNKHYPGWREAKDELNALPLG
ncbi:M48 family metallopeptidase [Mangrovitalea sediminis]|uniref:M48 family metallopeptidase n=1 Tax=Mangrovitalea sediminis TaxID=1982043 RepID=UPI000BE4DEF1|nr:SprT family zinc-dependent metalloprotease [Mangrovitalea sediminis]